MKPSGAKRAQPQKATAPAHWGGKPDPEKLDPVPMEMPIGAKTPMPLSEMIARAVHAELDTRDSEGHDSPEEADDFTEEDPETLDMTKYEQHFVEVDDPVDEIAEPREKLSPKEVLDRAYGEGNYPAEWAGGSGPDVDEETRPEVSD